MLEVGVTIKLTRYVYRTKLFYQVKYVCSQTITVLCWEYLFVGTISTTADAVYPIRDLSATTASLSFTATDMCGTTGTGVVTINIVNSVSTDVACAH